MSDVEASFEWKGKYEIGVAEIDFQHRYFLSLINRLRRELEGIDDPEYQQGLMSELMSYAKFHFISEENMMRRDGYPGLEQHHQHHQMLLEQLSTRVARLNITHSPQELHKLMRFLVDWFVHHTLNEDHQYAEYHNNLELLTLMPGS